MPTMGGSSPPQTRSKKEDRGRQACELHFANAGRPSSASTADNLTALTETQARGTWQENFEHNYDVSVPPFDIRCECLLFQAKGLLFARLAASLPNTFATCGPVSFRQSSSLPSLASVKFKLPQYRYRRAVTSAFK